MCVQGRMYLPSTSAQHSALLWLAATFPSPNSKQMPAASQQLFPHDFFYLLQQAQSKQPFVAETTGVNSLSSAYSEVHLLLTYLFAAPALLSVYLSLPSWWLWSPGSAEPFSKMGWWLYPVIPEREPVMIFQSAFPPFPFQDGKKAFIPRGFLVAALKGFSSGEVRVSLGMKGVSVDSTGKEQVGVRREGKKKGRKVWRKPCCFQVLWILPKAWLTTGINLWINCDLSPEQITSFLSQP